MNGIEDAPALVTPVIKINAAGGEESGGKNDIVPCRVFGRARERASNPLQKNRVHAWMRRGIWDQRQSVVDPTI